MLIGIGIDTGGTYTDAVIFDYETRETLAKGKSLTTKEDLTKGIFAAIGKLPRDLVTQAQTVALSTTLSTNACVEGKGGRAKLILIGSSRKTLEWVGADKKYGLNFEDVLCVETNSSFDGKIVDMPDWDEVITQNHDWLSGADAFGVADVFALTNGAVCEKKAKLALLEKYGVPVVMGSELASGLNVMERGATALLNARLLPIIGEFTQAAAKALADSGVNCKAMIVRSDGSLMADELSQSRPVETILSGPAASVLGGKGLTGAADCLIVDMGGTTTDISIVKGGVPVMTGGISIGGWRTQIDGVFIDTFGLGGDSGISIDGGKLKLSARRVLPLCVASAQWKRENGYNVINEGLSRLLKEVKPHSHPIHEFLYLVREPQDISKYSAEEVKLCHVLRDKPVMLYDMPQHGIDIYKLNSERLESEGIVMRCGLTPTDIMHIKGDFTLYDSEASTLAARWFMRNLADYSEDTDNLSDFTDEVYDLVKRKLYVNIIRVLLTHTYPDIYVNGVDEQTHRLIAESWRQYKRNGKNPRAFFAHNFTTAATLVGIGAPTRVFLPDVAAALGATCDTPEHAGVANAIGAALADVTAAATIAIYPNYTLGGIESYTIYTPDGAIEVELYEQAVVAAAEAACRSAEAEARKRGALGELSIETKLIPNTAYAREGQPINLGASVVATATAKIL